MEAENCSRAYKKKEFTIVNLYMLINLPYKKKTKKNYIEDFVYHVYYYC